MIVRFPRTPKPDEDNAKAVKDYLEGEIARAKRKKLLVKLYMSAC